MKQNRFTERLFTVVSSLLRGPFYLLKECQIGIKEALAYYRHPLFRRCDWHLSRRLGWLPPTWVYLNNYQHREPYGETPLFYYDWLTQIIPNAHHLRWIESGSGRGRGVFWLATHLQPEQEIKHQVTGVDLHPGFIQACRAIKLKHSIHSCHFMLSDFCKIDYQPYDVVFLYASCSDDDKLTDLAVKLLRLKAGSWVASVSFPIHDYAIDGTFQLKFEREIAMVWGGTTLYVSQRTDHLPF